MTEKAWRSHSQALERMHFLLCWLCCSHRVAVFVRSSSPLLRLSCIPSFVVPICDFVGVPCGCSVYLVTVTIASAKKTGAAQRRSFERMHIYCLCTSATPWRLVVSLRLKACTFAEGGGCSPVRYSCVAVFCVCSALSSAANPFVSAPIVAACSDWLAPADVVVATMDGCVLRVVIVPPIPYALSPYAHV